MDDDPADVRPGPGKGLTGAVVEALPSGLYRVRLEEGPVVVAHASDRADSRTVLNFVRLLVGDRVRVELSTVDPGRGRIVEKVRG
jgi:translation initiation factor IF-1